VSKYCFGIDIGGTSIKCGLFTESGELLDKWEIHTRTEDNGEMILPDAKDAIFEAMGKRGISKDEVIGVGLGVPGPVTEDGTVLMCANLGWDVFNVSERMGRLTGMPVLTANDANVAALGEMYKGGGRGYEDVIMVTLGTGVGGGIIIDGKVIAGSNGAAGEIGHMIVEPDETATCGCGGHGHLEQYASATGVVRMAMDALAENNEMAGNSSLNGIKKMTAKDVFNHAKNGDGLALRLVDRLGLYLGRALSHVSAVVDPQVFVIGGGVSKAGDILLDVIKKHYNDNILHALKGKEFRLAELFNDAGIYGCAKMVISQL